MKKWGIILGASMVAVAAINLFSILPTVAPVLAFISIMGGAGWATFEEIKEDIKEMKKEPPVILSTFQMEKEFYTLREQVNGWDIKVLTEKMKEVTELADKLNSSYNALTPSEQRYIQQTLVGDVKALFNAFEVFHPEERLKQSNSLIDVLEKVSYQLKEIYNKKQREAEEAFQNTKRVIQEKLTRF